jgi:spore germination cell wall hydrolase CwlJ-like protein
MKRAFSQALKMILGAGLAAASSQVSAQLTFAETASWGASEQDCLSLAIYYEARSESELGQQAVAEVVLNRVRDRAYPDSVCGVVFQGSQRQTGCQFSFTCDGSMARLPEGQAWQRAREIAVAALGGRADAGVGNATHYHTTAIQPYWSSSLTKVATIGAHIFYSKTRAADEGRISFARVEQVVLSAVDPQAEGDVTISVHRGKTSASK